MIDIKFIADNVDSAVLDDSFVTSSGYTAYRISEFCVETLTAMGYKGKMPTSQLFYGFAKKGMIDGVPSVKDVKKRYSEEVVVAFVMKFCKMWLIKNGVSTAKTNSEKAEETLKEIANNKK